jgi:hypothetical protein
VQSEAIKPAERDVAIFLSFKCSLKNLSVLIYNFFSAPLHMPGLARGKAYRSSCSHLDCSVLTLSIEYVNLTLPYHIYV